MKYQYEKDKESGLYSVGTENSLLYEAQFTFIEARRIVACMNANEDLTWNDIRDYVEGKTKRKPYTPKFGKATKHQAIRMTDENWQALGEIAKSVVTSDKPERASEKSNWQLAEMFRLIAIGKARVIID